MIERGALAARDGRIVFVGDEAELPAGWRDSAESSIASGRWITPGLIDCHTHLVYAGDRAQEFELRLDGASYEEIARAGGGIVATVAATRAASEDELVRQSLPRLDALIAEGVDDGRDQVRLRARSRHRAQDAARRAATGRRARRGVRTTFLGAHALPPEFSQRSRAAMSTRRRRDAAGARRRRAGRRGRRLLRDHRLHARRDRARVRRRARALEPAGQAACRSAVGPAAARRSPPTSARCRPIISNTLDEAGAAAMARAGDVAVLLPGAFYTLREKQAPPVALFRKHGVAMAVATDCNPGTSPLTSLLLALNMAATLVPPHRRRVPRRRHPPCGAGARARRPRPARSSRANGRIWRSGTSSARPSWFIGSASIRCTRASGGGDDGHARTRRRLARRLARGLARRAGRARRRRTRRRSQRAPPRRRASSRAASRSTASTPASASSPRVRIAAADLAELQRNIVLSHAAGVGAPASVAVTRLMMALKLASLAPGRLGRAARDAAPAGGDAGARRHAGRAGAGLGRRLGRPGAARPYGGGDDRRRRGAFRRSRACRRPKRSPPRGWRRSRWRRRRDWRCSTARSSPPPTRWSGCSRPKRCCAPPSSTGALSTDAARGSDAPFDARIHALRRHRGQIDVARSLRALMAGSAIRASHVTGDPRVQDPYCLRCQPQVMGACLDLLRQAAATLADEANGVSDNPLIFAESDEALSGGNFHAEPVAFAADIIALAICEIGSLAERRVAMLVDPALSGLPAFLTPRPGLNSGFMMAQVTAAALVSENKQRAYPASVDSIPTSANQEDHVSMAAHGARRLAEMARKRLRCRRRGMARRRASAASSTAPLASSAPLEARAGAPETRGPAPRSRPLSPSRHRRGDGVGRAAANWPPRSARRRCRRWTGRGHERRVGLAAASNAARRR